MHACSKTSKEQMLTVALQNYAKNQLQKTLQKPFLLIFVTLF